MSRAVTVWATAALLGAAAFGQGVPEWRRIGGFTYDRQLPSSATGPVERVWFSPDGARLYARTALGRLFETVDFEKWQPLTTVAEPPEPGVAAAVERFPSPRSRLMSFGSRIYALGDQVYRSEDGGKSWANLTAYKAQSIIGGPPRSLAVSPLDPDDLVVANDFGVWRSLDGGLSWTGLNDELPNLPAVRILSVPASGRPARILAAGAGELELLPGTDTAWNPSESPTLTTELELIASLSGRLSASITAVARRGDNVYAGSADGRLWASLDGGRTWPWLRGGAGQAVTRIVADAREGRLALATIGAGVARTTNGGAFWDDITGNLAGGLVLSVAADTTSGAIYAATERGVFSARVDLQNAALPAAVAWTRLAGLPNAPARDAALDAAGNQLYVALEGYGLFGTAAPHRRRNLRVVNAADLSSRAAAPGSLLSVLGARVQSAQAGELRFPVLAAGDQESQLQVPFEAAGPELALAIQAPSGSTTVPLAVRSASPAIFVSPDGAPMLLDGDSGLMLDASTPARSNSRIQVLATGLGRVRPNWPTGLAAPLNDPPAVMGNVSASLDRVPVQVSKATLAPGYVGFYVVEIQLPAVVNSGPAELFIAVDGQESNRVRVYLEP